MDNIMSLATVSAASDDDDELDDDEAEAFVKFVEFLPDKVLLTVLVSPPAFRAIVFKPPPPPPSLIHEQKLVFDD